MDNNDNAPQLIDSFDNTVISNSCVLPESDAEDNSIDPDEIHSLIDNSISFNDETVDSVSSGSVRTRITNSSVNNILNDNSQMASGDLELADKVHSKIVPGAYIERKYRIDEEIGTGGYATVYRARHLALDRNVAIKVMDVGAGVDATYVERFIREAKIAAKLNHTNIVSIYDYGVIPDSGQPYIVMELLKGHDLYDEIYTIGPIGPKRAYRLFLPLLEALGTGHRLGIIHKDLKPENLFISLAGEPDECMKVVDFGVARIEDNQYSKLTVNGQVTGTPRFLAPEYILNQTVSPAIDVYQMALIISEAITGRPAVMGDPVASMTAHCNGDIKIADFLQRGAIGKVFLKALALDPKDRYRNCDEFAKALESIKDEFDRDVLIDRSVSVISGKCIEDDDIAPSKSVSINAKKSVQSVPAVSVPTSPIVVKTSDTPTAVVSQNTNKKLTLVFLLIIFIILLIPAVILYKIYLGSDEPVQVLPEEPVKYIFSLTTTPNGAAVIDTTDEKELCRTPCQVHLETERLPLRIRFSRGGYHDYNYILSTENYSEDNGFVVVNLTQSCEYSIRRVSTIVADIWNSDFENAPVKKPDDKKKDNSQKTQAAPDKTQDIDDKPSRRRGRHRDYTGYKPK